MTATLAFKGPAYFSQGDEDAFFGWLKRIGCVEGVRGVGANLHVQMKPRPVADGELRELIALLHRYQLDKSSLAQFLTEENRGWFRDDGSTYWPTGERKCSGDERRTY